MKIIINELDLLKKTVIIQSEIKKKYPQLFSIKLTEKIPDPCNAKEHYQSFIRKKNTKLLKQLKIVIQQPKTFENLNIVDINSVITEHPKTSHKLSRTIRQFPSRF